MKKAAESVMPADTVSADVFRKYALNSFSSAAKVIDCQNRSGGLTGWPAARSSQLLRQSRQDYSSSCRQYSLASRTDDY
jgi:hypothetical protein